VLRRRNDEKSKNHPVFGMMSEDASSRLDLDCLTALKERRPEEAVKALAQVTGA
jgi:hypothetical protein